MCTVLLCTPFPPLPGEVVIGEGQGASAVNRLRWDLSPQQIHQLTEQLMEATSLVYDRVGALELDSVTYENTLKELADVEVEYTGRE
ncbi:UNVERIFIED_CONTAM: hypothetical protein FKN15_043349 [Acipenser sinensis]